MQWYISGVKGTRLKGAVSLPLSTFVVDGKLKPKEELKQLTAYVHEGKTLVCLCNFGIQSAMLQVLIAYAHSMDSLPVIHVVCLSDILKCFHSETTGWSYGSRCRVAGAA